MFKWWSALLARLRGRAPAKQKVAFNERERIDPVIQLVDESFIVGEVRVVDQIVQRRTRHDWEPVCYLPKQEEISRVEDLPALAPFGWRYVVDGVDWTFDGMVWVSNKVWHDKPTMFTRPFSVTPASGRAHVRSTPVTANPQPTDNGIMMTAMIASMASDDSSPTRSHSSSHHDSDDNCRNHDSNDSGYSSSDFGSSFCD